MASYNEAHLVRKELEDALRFIQAPLPFEDGLYNIAEQLGLRKVTVQNHVEALCNSLDSSGPFRLVVMPDFGVCIWWRRRRVPIPRVR